MLLALLVLAVVAVVLAAPVAIRACARRIEAARAARRPAEERPLDYDPGRERRAEQRARQLLRSCVNDEEWGMYRDLGFIRVAGSPAPAAARRAARATIAPSDTAAVRLPPLPAQADRGLRARRRAPAQRVLRGVPRPRPADGSRLPASDDVLAKWMALTSDESRVIGQANMHLVGRQLDPARVRRDLWRLSEWERRRAGSAEARRA